MKPADELRGIARMSSANRGTIGYEWATTQKKAAALLDECERVLALVDTETGGGVDDQMPHGPREALLILRRAASPTLAKLRGQA